MGGRAAIVDEKGAALGIVQASVELEPYGPFKSFILAGPLADQAKK
jgi:hypothetical protein